MNRLKQHIGLFLMAILVFPIVFQFTHVFHDHGFGTEPPSCHESCCTALPCSGSGLIVSQETNHCPICEYEFASFNLDRKQECTLINFSHNETRILPVNGKLGANVLVYRKLRAPPAFM